MPCPHRLIRHAALLSLLTLSACEDPPASALRPDRTVADVADAGTTTRWAVEDDAFGETLEEPEPVAVGVMPPSASAAAAKGFTIRDLSLPDGAAVAGPERFTVRVEMASPLGDRLTGYGIRTPYEDGVHAFASLPMAIRDGEVRIRVAPLSTTPRRGRYPFEFWLLNDRHEASNRLQGTLTVQ